MNHPNLGDGHYYDQEFGLIHDPNCPIERPEGGKMIADPEWLICKWCDAPIYQREDGVWTHGHGGEEHCITTIAEPEDK